MSDDELTVIEGHVARLELALMKQLKVLGHEAEKQGSGSVRMPREILERLRGALRKLQDALHGTGNGARLSLVSEKHDTLRIRMLYMQNLLAVDMPRRYVELALEEFITATRAHVAPEAARGGRPRQRPEKQPKGLWARFRAFLRELFGIRPQADPKVARAKPRPTEQAPRLEEIYSEQELRIIYLHKLMEEDVLELLPEDSRLPPVSGGVELPAQVARFSARDFAETYFGAKASTSDGSSIARTPEELRAKLAARGDGGRSEH